MAETVLIEFIVDTTQIQSAIDLLEKIGQVDAKTAANFKQANAEINKQSSAIKATAAAAIPLKKNIEDVNRATKSMTTNFMQGFEQGVIETLKEAGVSLDEFLAALKNGPSAAASGTESLRQRLKNLTQQLGELKLAGQDNTEQFQQLRAEAAKIQDAMADAGQEIRNVASDTGVFDGLIGAAQGIAGGFAVAQGVTALFGDESEELQKTLLKVNAAMAILQGLQQVQTVLQKESAAATLGDTIAKNFNIVATRLYTAITGQATAATTAFKVALAATGIGLLVVGIIAAVQAFKEFSGGADEAAEAQNRLNEAIANTNKALVQSNEIYVESLNEQKANLEQQLALAEARGDSEIKLLTIRRQIAREEESIGKKSLENLGLTRVGVERLDLQYFRLIQRIATLNEVAQKDPSERGQKAAEELRKQLQTEADAIKPLLDAGVKAIEQIDAAQNKSALTFIAIEKQKEKERKESLLRQLNDELAGLERKLLTAEAGSEKELRLQQEIASKKAQIELTNENLTKQQRLLIREQTLKENLEKEKAYNEKLTQEQLNAQISRNNVLLANINVTDEARLRLSIANIELAAQLEIEAANNNSEKIKEIIAKREADIVALKKNFIDQQAQAEIDRITVIEGVETRALQRITQNEKLSAQTRITAIRQLAETELNFIAIRENALEEQRRKGLIGEQDYNDKYKKLQDEKAQVSERTEEKITAIHESEAEKRKRIQQENVESAIQTTQQVLSLLDNINSVRAEQDQQRIEGERARVQELLESGAITEKEAIARNKRIDAEDKKLKREAAQRDKNIALFNAIINTAAAVTKALPNLILAGIAAALGAGQIATIAARPIPKFRTGKKNEYEGPGIIGEAGQELFEHEGQTYLAKKETLVWLGKSDKVYTPAETKRMLPSVDRRLMKQPEPVFGNDIDYERLAKEVGKEVGKHVKIPGLTVDENGFKAFMQDGLSRQQYMDKYYSFPK